MKKREIIIAINENAESNGTIAIDNIKFKTNSNGELEIKNHTLEELQQKLINDMYNAKGYGINEISILKILFENYDI